MTSYDQIVEPPKALSSYINEVHLEDLIDLGFYFMKRLALEAPLIDSPQITPGQDDEVYLEWAMTTSPVRLRIEPNPLVAQLDYWDECTSSTVSKEYVFDGNDRTAESLLDDILVALSG